MTIINKTKFQHNCISISLLDDSFKSKNLSYHVVLFGECREVGWQQDE